MPSSVFEKPLIELVQDIISDIEPEVSIDGYGKKWIANLYSKQQKIVIEACSRKVVRRGITGSSLGVLHERFHALLFKLIDIKANNPEIRAVMLWGGSIPCTSMDLAACSKWGIYVLTIWNIHRLNDVLNNVPPEEVNRDSLNYISRKKDRERPKWLWLADERKKLILEMLEKQPLTGAEIAEQLGVDYYRVCRFYLQDLLRKGLIKRLIRLGKGHASLYGISDKQLDQLPLGRLNELLTGKKRVDFLKGKIIDLLHKNNVMNFRELCENLYPFSWHEVQGALSDLHRKGVVRKVGPPWSHAWKLSS